jgi:hypothetical protein
LMHSYEKRVSKFTPKKFQEAVPGLGDLCYKIASCQFTVFMPIHSKLESLFLPSIIIKVSHAKVPGANVAQWKFE